MTRLQTCFLAWCLLAATLPLLPWRTPPITRATPFPGWPTTLDGRPLRPLPLTALEQRFQTGFPGKMARFTDGEREIILRWVNAPSRKLHPSIDCFKAHGYQLTLQPAIDKNGQQWSRFIARKGHDTWTVEERIIDTQGRQWRDASAWYWSAVLNQSEAPWWAITTAQPTRQ
ncbi:hypothetical protein HNQ59_002344 [Chitinivorax tropicus]|uniref:Uncharacterized protein n=1 Tax=Chitinivorax tropicus TaxID=714531 RepID=A0A840MRI2_9PROT|nr:hypothetical protein [Chitinivorax tropicus]MBB5019046.1 hypothetical protein [Chitinivorax tropicus]